MMTILQSMSNLIQLKLDTDLIDYDGYRWEDIIDNNLPKLKVFHLKMHMKLNLYHEENNEEQVDQLMNSFRSRFWLEKHQWYIRSHFKSELNCMAILLYTLPYAFVDFDSKTLLMPYKFFFTRGLSSIYFSNIRNLRINLPVGEIFWKIVPTIHQLQSLTVSSVDVDALSHLQTLLNRVPELQSLKIQS